jgi:hypothetical protein
MRYVVLDPGSSEPTYGLVGEAVLVETDDESAWWKGRKT